SCHGLTLLLQVVVSLNQEAACAASGIEDCLAETRVHRLHHELHHGARCIELPILTSRVPHLLKHRLIKVTQREQLISCQEADRVDFVDHVPEQVSACHPVHYAREHRGDHGSSPSPAIGASQAPEVGKQAEATFSI